MDTILYDTVDGVAQLTLNRPKVLNSINTQMIADVREAVAQFAADETARVLLITGSGRGFAVIASCEVLSGGAIGAPVDPVILTVTVTPAAQGGTLLPDALALAAAQAPARVLERVEARGLTLVHLGSGGDAISRGGDPRHWRGALLVNGHLVMLALYTGRDSPLAGSSGQVLMRQVAARIERVSPAPGSAALPQAPSGRGKDVAE